MVILKMSSCTPLDFWRKVQKNSVFKKWSPSVPDEHQIFFCGDMFSNKRSILTHSGIGIPFLSFFFYYKHILDPEIQDGGRKQHVSSEILTFPFVGLFRQIKIKF